MSQLHGKVCALNAAIRSKSGANKSLFKEVRGELEYLAKRDEPYADRSEFVAECKTAIKELRRARAHWCDASGRVTKADAIDEIEAIIERVVDADLKEGSACKD